MTWAGFYWVITFLFYLCFIALFLEIPAYGAIGCDGDARNAIHKLRSRIEEQEKKVAINVKSWSVLKTGGGMLCGSEDGDLRRAILKIHKYMNDLEAGTV